MDIFYYCHELPENIKAFMKNEHRIYENMHNVICSYTPFCFVAENDAEIIGALTGYTAYEEIYIDDLVVAEAYRRKGVGTSLLKKVEDTFSKMHFSYITLCTNAFQAPNFYKKCGYQLEFMRENKNTPQLSKYFFIKYIK